MTTTPLTGQDRGRSLPGGTGDDDREIPFRFGEPIKVEVEFIGDRKRELEIELEFEWAEGSDSLNVG